MLKVARAAFAVACSDACQTPTSVRVTLKWLHMPLASRQLAVIHHTTD